MTETGVSLFISKLTSALYALFGGVADGVTANGASLGGLIIVLIIIGVAAGALMKSLGVVRRIY